VRLELEYLTSELVKRPSVSMEPFRNMEGIREASSFIMGWLKENGVHADIVELDKGWPSVVAGEKDAKILLLGHFDVVPPGDKTKWEYPPFSGEIREGKVFGRGSNDMKGGVAVFMELAKRFPVGMFLSPDEEIGSLHSTVLFQRKVNPELVLVSEPSGSRNMVVGEKGTVIARVRGRGEPAHGSLPWRGRNAVDDALETTRKVVDLLRSVEVEIPRELEEAYHNSSHVFGEDSRRITVNLGVIRGGDVPTMVPDSACVELDIRFPHGTPRDVLERLAESCDVEFVAFPNYYLGKWVEELERSAESGGVKLQRVIDPADNDGRLFRERGIPAICYGPGSEFRSHVYNEFVEVRELEEVFSTHTPSFCPVWLINLSGKLK